LASLAFTFSVMKRTLWIRLSRDARSGDSRDTRSCLMGARTFASSALISLRNRDWSASSWTIRSRCWATRFSESSLAWTSGVGPCLQATAATSAIGSQARRAAERLV